VLLECHPGGHGCFMGAHAVRGEDVPLAVEFRGGGPGLTVRQ
jgi:hypothetical protein